MKNLIIGIATILLVCIFSVFQLDFNTAQVEDFKLEQLTKDAAGAFAMQYNEEAISKGVVLFNEENLKDGLMAGANVVKEATEFSKYFNGKIINVYFAVFNQIDPPVATITETEDLAFISGYLGKANVLKYTFTAGDFSGDVSSEEDEDEDYGHETDDEFSDSDDPEDDDAEDPTETEEASDDSDSGEEADVDIEDLEDDGESDEVISLGGSLMGTFSYQKGKLLSELTGGYFNMPQRAYKGFNPTIKGPTVICIIEAGNVPFRLAGGSSPIIRIGGAYRFGGVDKGL